MAQSYSFAQLVNSWLSNGGDPVVANTMGAIGQAESHGTVPDYSTLVSACQGTLAPGSYPGLAYWPGGSAAGGAEISGGPWQVNEVNSCNDLINYMYPDGPGTDPTKSLDGATALAIARYKAQGLGAWSTYTSGTYLNYLNGQNSSPGGPVGGGAPGATTVGSTSSGPCAHDNDCVVGAKGLLGFCIVNRSQARGVVGAATFVAGGAVLLLAILKVAGVKPPIPIPIPV